MASIENVLAGASAGDYFAAAQFYYQSNGDINKARTYIDKALEMSATILFFTPEIIDFKGKAIKKGAKRQNYLLLLLKPRIMLR
jgi:hypothetical protein